MVSSSGSQQGGDVEGVCLAHTRAFELIGHKRGLYCNHMYSVRVGIYAFPVNDLLIIRGTYKGSLDLHNAYKDVTRAFMLFNWEKLTFSQGQLMLLYSYS